MSDDNKTDNIRTFKAATEPYQALVDLYKANCHGDIKMLCQAALVSKKLDKDVHSEFASCLMQVRETNATKLPQEPIIDKKIIAELCCHGHLDDFYKEFERIKDVDPVDHNTDHGQDRVTRMTLLDTRPAIAVFLNWLNDGDKWKSETSQGKPQIGWIYGEGGKEMLFNLLESTDTEPFESPAGIELHKRINEALESVGLEQDEDTHCSPSNPDNTPPPSGSGKPTLTFVKK